MVTPVRVGIVGAGFIARAHAAAYAATPGVDIVGIADPVLAKAAVIAARVGAEVVADAAALIGLGVDAVSVCTPSPTHADVVEAAVAAGVDVLCEKPIARSLEDGRRIVEAAKRGPGLVMIGHVSRYEPDHARAREAIAANAIGDIRMLSQSIVSAAPGWSEESWLLDAHRSGGPLIDLAIHSFDFLAWASGSQPVRVQAVAADTAAGPETYVLVTLRYTNGAIGLVEASWGHPAAYGFQVATEFSGATGRLWWDYAGIKGGHMATTDGAVTPFETLGDRGFRAEIGAFIDAVRTGGPSPVPAVEALAALRTGLAAEASLREGRPVGLDEIGA